MDTIQPSEKAMQNLYKFLGRVLPKYLANQEIKRSTRTTNRNSIKVKEPEIA